MRIVVTGATGLLGKYVISNLKKSGHQVVALYRSDIPAVPELRESILWQRAGLDEPENLNEIFTGSDVVVHAAARVSFRGNDFDKLFDTNVTGTRNVVNACLTSGVGRLIHVSSVAALGKYPGSNLVDESAPWAGGTSDYGRTKYLAELEVSRGSAEGLVTSIVNPSVILAPGDLDRSTGRIFRYIMNGNLFYASGTGGFVDVRDVARAIETLLNFSDSGERFILNGFSMTWKDFMQSLAKGIGVRQPVMAVPQRLMLIAARMESVRSWLLGSEPLITPTSIRLSAEVYQYNTLKIKQILGFNFTDQEDTINWISSQLKAGK